MKLPSAYYGIRLELAQFFNLTPAPKSIITHTQTYLVKTVVYKFFLHAQRHVPLLFKIHFSEGTFNALCDT